MPQNAVEGRNTPARPTPIQKPAAKPVQNEQPTVSPVQPVVQQMAAEEKENMDTLPAGKVEENAPNMELPVPSREVTLDKMKKAGASVYADAPVVDQFVDELTINPASWVIYHLFNLKLVFWHDSLLFIMYYVLKVGQ